MASDPATPIWLYRLNRRFYFARRMRWSDFFVEDFDPARPGRDPLLWFAWEAGNPWGLDDNADYLVLGLKTKKEMLQALYEEAYGPLAAKAPAQAPKCSYDDRQWRLADDFASEDWQLLMETGDLHELLGDERKED